MYKVIIVDDEDIIVNGLRQVMPWEKYGCQVVAAASDGLEAQRVMRAQRPDILFTDIRMPGLDGLALIAAIRSEFPGMQVTILSGYPDFEYAQRAIGLGAVSYTHLRTDNDDSLINTVDNTVRILQEAKQESATSDEQLDVIKREIVITARASGSQIFLSDAYGKIILLSLIHI